MPPISSPAKVLVTGANGYLGAWVARNFLEHGYHVRGTVRSAPKGDELNRIFAAYGDSYESVIVKDVLKVGLQRRRRRQSSLIILGRRI